MTRRLKTLTLLAGLAAVGTPLCAYAQTGTIADWGPNGYAYESSYGAPTAYVSNAGSQLKILAVINGFLGPLAGFDASLTSPFEYTVYIHNLASAGTVITLGGFANTYKTVYNGSGGGGLANFEIYEDGAKNAVFGTNPDATTPATFTDGTLFLSGVFHTMTVTFARQNNNGTILGGNFDTGEPTVADIFTGGREFPKVSIAGHGCPMRITGGWLARPGNFPVGYSAHPDGKFDISCPTDATPSTWGRMKSLYH